MSGATASVQTNPFPGLRPFREDEEHLFFGRENQVDAMVNKLADTRFLAVVGTSGSGKSSLVNCGLRPALRQGLMARAGTAWRMAQFRPGSDPIGAMARALAQDGVLFREHAAAGLSLAEIVETSLRMSKLGLIDIHEQAQLDEGVNLLVVVDQFEELFRYRQLEAAGRGDAQGISEDTVAFVNLLLEIKERANCPIYVVLTMRSDFLGDCTQFPGLAEAINAGQYLVPRMARDERRAAIASPVGVGGAEISPVLLTRLVNDVGDNPDQLSILQHALNRTWARWQNEGDDKGPLELAHYEAIGTMARALDLHAEKAYAELASARQKQICEKLFKALTDKATDRRGIRRPTNLGTLCALADATAAEVTEVIDVFRQTSRSFLMPPAGEALNAETVIDISHESLMRVWQRLHVWADEEARSAWTYRRLADTAALHSAGKAGLWRDPDLQLALDWRDQNQPNETWAARYHPGFAAAMPFLTQSSDAREVERAERTRQRRRELEAEQEKAETQARYARRMGWWALFSGALTLVAVIGSGWAVKAQQEARALTRIADSGRLANASLVSRMDRPNLAALLAVEALNVADTTDASDALAMALQSHPRLETVLNHKVWMLSVAFGPDGTLASAGEDGTVQLRRRGESGLMAIGAPLQAHKGWVRSVAFGPDRTLASAGDDGAVRLWRLRTSGATPIGEPLQGHKGWVSSVAFGPDGTLASAGEDGTVRLWRLGKTGATPLGQPLQGHRGTVWSVAFGPGGTLASGSEDGTVRVWRLGDAGATPLGGPLQYHKGWVRGVAFGPDGTLASAGADGVRLWRLEGAGAKPLGGLLQDHKGGVRSVAFGPDGTLASGGDDGTVRLWRFGKSEMTQLGEPLQAHKGGVWSVAFGPDGALASGGRDRTLRFWRLGKPGATPLGEPLEGHNGLIRSVAFGPDGTLASGSEDGTVRLWRFGTSGATPFGEPLDHKGWVRSVAFGPDGTLASGGPDGTVRLWRLDESGAKPLGQPLRGHKGGVRSVAFGPGGTLASGGKDGTVRLWRLGTSGATPFGEPLQGHIGPVRSVAFGPNGTLASGSEDETVRLWRLGTSGATPFGEPLHEHDGGVWSVAFGPDGTLASAGEDGTLRLWRLGTSGAAPLGEPLRGHKSGVWSVAFGPDGTLASGSEDETVRLWRLGTSGATPLGEPLQDHNGWVRSVAFAPDGTLASGAGRGTVRLWRLGKSGATPTGEHSPRAAACRLASRNFSLTEWRSHMADTPYRRTCPALPPGEGVQEKSASRP